MGRPPGTPMERSMSPRRGLFGPIVPKARARARPRRTRPRPRIMRGRAFQARALCTPSGRSAASGLASCWCFWAHWCVLRAGGASY